MKIRYALISLVCIGILLITCTNAGTVTKHPFGLDQHHPYGVLTMDYETSHVKWARPYYKGDTRALVLAPMWTQRETVELAQRFSLDYTPWMCMGFDLAAPGSKEITSQYLSTEAISYYPPTRMLYEHLEEYLSDKSEYDVIVIGKLDWQMLSAGRRFELLKKVAEGTGLVYVKPQREHEELKIVFDKNPVDDDGFITAGVPLSALPRFKGLTAEELVKTSMFGKGRVVRLIYDEPEVAIFKGRGRGRPGSDHSLTPRWVSPDARSGWTNDHEPLLEEFYYDYYHSLLAKALLWAGGKEPEIHIAHCELKESIDRGKIAGEKVSLHLTQETNAPKEAVVRFTVRSTHGDILCRDESPVRFKDTRAVVNFELPVIASGQYFADVHILERTGDKVINWGSFAFEVAADIKIQNITPANRIIDRADEIEAELTLSRKLRDDETCEVSLWDSLGRKIKQLHFTEAGPSLRFSLGPADPLVIMHEIRAIVSSNGKIVTEARKRFPIRKGNRTDEFSSIMWSEVQNNHLNYMMLRKLRSRDMADAVDLPWKGHLLTDRLPAGFDPQDRYSKDVEMDVKARNLAMADLKVLGYNYRFGVLGGDKNHQLQGPCFSDPEWLAQIDDAFTKDAQVFGPYGPIGWTHGDETFLSEDPDVCWSPSCLAGLRQFLKKEYGDLASLNESWSSNWQSWDAIMPSTYDQARKSGNFPPWLDHKRSMNVIFATLFDRACDALRTGDAGARTGFDGQKGFWLPNGGIDLWKQSQSRGIMQVYNETGEMEVFRSFLRPGTLSGVWYGTYGENFSRPTSNEFSHYVEWNTLLNQLNSTWFWTMGRPGPLSGYAPDMTSLPYFEARTKTLREIKSGIDKLLLNSSRQNNGIAIHYSDSSRIAESLYSEKKGDWSGPFAANLKYYYSILEAQQLGYDFVSYEQIEQGKLFKDNFGVLIMPYSRSISRREAERIREFVKAGGVVIADIIPGILDEHGKKQTPGLLEDMFGPGKTGQRQTVLTEVSVKPYGKGKVLVIGDRSRACGISAFGISDRRVETLRPNAEAFGDILEKHTQVKPVVRATLTNRTKTAPPVVIRRFKADDIELVSLLRYYFAGDNKPYPYKIKFHKKSHLYDIRAKKYLGYTDWISTEMAYETHLYAMSPYRVKSLEVMTDNKVCQSGESAEISVKLTKDKAGRQAAMHVFRMRVFGPGGEELEHYSRSIIGSDGGCTAKVTFAINDEPGDYLVEVQDVISGTQGTRKITLER